MEKMNGDSLNIVQANIAIIKEIFPNVINEKKIDFDMLRTILGDEVDTSKEKYQFTWPGKSAAIKLAQSPSSATLRPCKEKSKNWDSTENLYIEGDNLEVLKQLQKTYYSKIKMIYIDPPYNTGNDFIYKDDFKKSIENYKGQTNQKISSNPSTSGRFHSDWLNLMYPRLILARNLLSENGVIFISIDDNEQDNLKRICDEIFGSTNYIGMFVINSTPNARDYGSIGKMHEYCLFYAKDRSRVETYMLPDTDKNFKYQDDVGGYNIHPLYNSNEAFHSGNRPNLFYPFYLYLDRPLGDNFYEIGFDKNNNCVEVLPPKSLKNGVQFVWRWGKEKASNNLNSEIIGYETLPGEYRIVQKMRHSEKIIRSLLTDKKYSSRRGTAEVEELLGGKFFNFPKPISLLYDFCKTALSENDIVLDFFSGSGTTAHAVMQLNSEDGGNRKFILVQLPEKCDENSEAAKNGYETICDIGEERIRRSGERINANSEIKVNKNDLLTRDNSIITDVGFKVFKLDSTNINPWDNTKEYDEQSIFNTATVFKLDRTNEDVLYEIILKYGIFDQPVGEVDINGKKMFRVGNRHMIVCLEDEVNDKDIEEICKLEPKVVIFKDGGFKDDNVKLNAEYNLHKAGVEDVKCI